MARMEERKRDEAQARKRLRSTRLREQEPAPGARREIDARDGGRAPPDEPRRGGTTEVAAVPREHLAPHVARLQILQGPGRGRTFDVGARSLVVGRSTDADQVLADASVSRRHALFRVGDGRLFVQDLGSRNGTRVNGGRVREFVLCDGDRVALGAVVLKVRLLDDDEEALAETIVAERTELDETRGNRPPGGGTWRSIRS